jgi:F-type H+-transporting ATPase subunit delta
MAEVENIPTVLDATSLKIGEAYARALLAQGDKETKVDLFVDQLGAVQGVLDQLPKLKAVLESPRVDYATKASMLDRAFQGKLDATFMNFMKLLARKGRFDCFRAIHSAAVKLQDEVAGRIRAVVTTASEMSDDSRRKLEERLSGLLGKQVLVSTSIDPEIIGGVVVRVGDTVYDASVANRLRQVKSKAIKGVTEAIRKSFDRFAVDA